jgi:tricorn protease
VFSPDGSTIAFTGEYDGNTDVFTIPAGGGVPHRVTYHPSVDTAVGWSPDGKQIVFRSDRQANSRYTQLYEVPAAGGFAKALPLPMAFEGQISSDGASIAYSPLGPSFSFDYNRYVAWGNYRGGRASTIWITGLKDLASTEIPHETASDLNPVWVGKLIYFLSDRNGPMTLYKYDPATKAVTECLKNAGKPDIHSLSGGPGGLVYDQLGEIYLYDPASGQSHMVPIDVTGDLPEVRARIENVSTQIDHVGISPTGLRAVFEAHGEILTVPVKKGPTRDITNTPGVMERSPAWSPDGQLLAYFSDESGLYAVHVSSQTGSGEVKKYACGRGRFLSDRQARYRVVAGFEVDRLLADCGEPSARAVSVFGGDGQIDPVRCGLRRFAFPHVRPEWKVPVLYCEHEHWRDDGRSRYDERSAFAVAQCVRGCVGCGSGFAGCAGERR